MSNADEKEVETLEERLEKAETLEVLAALETEMASIELMPNQRYLIRMLNMAKKAAEDAKKAAEDAKKAAEDADLLRKTTGLYLADIKNVWTCRVEEFPKEGDLLVSFNYICREKTPEYYKPIIQAAETKTKAGRLQDPHLESLGSNSHFPKRSVDLFNKPIDPSKAHVFLDSKACGPGWGLVAEGATGKIKNRSDQDTKEIRILRMMGGKSDSKACLRYSIHNFISLAADHRTWYDAEPQFMIIPILPLSAIKGWDVETDYSVLVVAASNGEDEEEIQKGDAAASIYRHVMSNFDWGNFDDKADVCKPDEIQATLKVLRHFIKALAHTLELEIPVELLKFSESKMKGAKKGTKKTKSAHKKSHLADVVEDESMEPTHDGSNNANSSSLGDDWSYQELKELMKKEGGVSLPFFDKISKNGCEFKKIKNVLKLHLKHEDGPLPDPWLLMVKAAVNYSFIRYGHTFLPARKALPDESLLQYEEALRDYERRERQRDIPSSFSFPSTPSTPFTPGANLGMSELPDKKSKKTEIEENDSWEYISDDSL